MTIGGDIGWKPLACASRPSMIPSSPLAYALVPRPHQREESLCQERECEVLEQSQECQECQEL